MAARGVYRDVRMNVSFIGARQKILFALKYGRAKSYLLCVFERRAVQCNVMGASPAVSFVDTEQPQKQAERGVLFSFSRRQPTPGESENVSMRVCTPWFTALHPSRKIIPAFTWKLFLFPANLTAHIAVTCWVFLFAAAINMDNIQLKKKLTYTLDIRILRLIKKVNH